MGRKISKNFEIVKKIETLEELSNILETQKSIYVNRWDRISPTAFLLSWQFRLIKSWLYSGCFFEIKKIKN